MTKDRNTVLVSGASGLVGSALCQALKAKGYGVKRLSRTVVDGADVCWDVEAGSIDADAMQGVATVVHLAGEPVAQRWTVARKAQIMQSRVKGAQLLIGAMLEQPTPPDYISASGIHFYGAQCAAETNEASPSGAGFLAEVCREWEAAAQPLREVGVRTVFMRMGLVLSAHGGALSRMLPAFRLGLGGRIGSGQQRMSWVSLSDLVNMILLAIEDKRLHGPVNAVSPQVVTNAAFTRTLGTLLRRPTILPMPACIVQILFGAMGQETLCSDIAAVPQALHDVDFAWTHRDLHACLRACIEQRVK